VEAAGLLLSYLRLGPNHLNFLPNRGVILIFSARKQETLENIGILIIEDDAASQAALRQMLGAEGWVVEGASSSQALRELATGKWSLVLANIATTGVTGALYATLRELALPPDGEAAKARVRVLFLVPEAGAAQTTPLLEQEHLPYVVKPFTFHDLLERVSDLLMETEAIGTPLRRVKQEGLASGRRSRRGRETSRDGNRNTGMFANREDYQLTEEELAEYERQEIEAVQKKKKKKLIPLD
jgi:DNA-binding response OmpR family regulator